MGILDTLLSLLGLGDSASSDGRRETTVSVERERAETESEAAVKGADSVTAGTDTAASADTPVDVESGAAEPAEAAGPGAGDAETELGTVEAESAGETTGEHDDPEEVAESVEVIKGIGPAYAERLAAVGVESVSDLAAADAADLAPKVDLSEKRVGRWIDRAEDR
jgi:predicted flap endonuclease-1-like 5' DNA nuclease